MPEPTMTPAPPGWYFCRIFEGDMHIQRYPVAVWRTDHGDGTVPLIAKPGRRGLIAPGDEDWAGFVGLCPPDREYQSYFTSEDLQDAVKRLFVFHHPEQARRYAESTVREVHMPGVGDIGVRDASPPGQRGAAGWTDEAKRRWGLTGQARLGGS